MTTTITTMAPTTDHFDGERFFNPTGPPLQPLTAVPRMLLERRTTWPAAVDSRQTRPAPRGDASAVVTFIGHSTFLIQTAAANILTDPMYSGSRRSVELLGPRRVRPPAVALDDLPPIGVVLLSHNHYDHCDLPTLRRLAQRFDPIVVTPLGNGPILRSGGVQRVEELDWWHSAGTAFAPDHPDAGASFLGPHAVRSQSRAVGWIRHDRRIPADLLRGGHGVRAVLQRDPAAVRAARPGASADRRLRSRDGSCGAVHMNPEEAVQAHVELGAAESIGMHFGTFQLTTEGIDEPVRALEQELRKRDLPPGQFCTIDFGQSVRLA